MLLRISVLLIVLTGAGPASARPSAFHLSFDAKALSAPFTGRVYLILTPNKQFPILRSLNWGTPEQMLIKDVQNWKPEQILKFDATTTAYPASYREIKSGRYFAQAVLDRDLGGISFSASPGNVYSAPVEVQFSETAGEVVSLRLDRVYEEPQFRETPNVKLFEIESNLLTQFHGKLSRMRAGVVLPDSFQSMPTRKYPVVYEITGFGGDHRAAFQRASMKAWDLNGVECIWVVLDANCRLGHHVFADSANNGPVGRALVEELIPALENRFRGAGDPAQRLVTGHSSGGWSSLWLQVTYPETFGGCWSTAPDPVDFRDFQRVNLYQPNNNLFFDEEGQPRPLSRNRRGKGLIYQDFSNMERIMGRGGQLGSFEAVFSPRDESGKPKQLWNRDTGAIDIDVAEAWKKYDIRLIVEGNWDQLKMKLAGKLHVWMGDEDTFYLEGATKLLQKSLAKLGSDAEVELFPGRDHGLMNASPLRRRMQEEMAAKLRGKSRP